MKSKDKSQRVVIKLSGAVLQGNSNYNINPKVLDFVASEIKKLITHKFQVGIVIGGGNLFRGETLSAIGIGRITGDHMGMLATLVNALALRDAFERTWMPTRIMSAIPMSGIVDHYERRKAIHHLTKYRVVIFAAGTGNPLVTTDSAASLRAIEVEANLLIKVTNVDGVYDKDPKQHKDAQRFDTLSYQEVIRKELGVMDLTAFAQCRDHNLKIKIVNFQEHEALLHAAQGRKIGTLIS